MDRAYRGRPCLGGGRTRLVQPIPTSPVATATFITRHDLALSGCAIAGYKGWTVTIRGCQPRNHAHWNRRYARLGAVPGVERHVLGSNVMQRRAGRPALCGRSPSPDRGGDEACAS